MLIPLTIALIAAVIPTMFYVYMIWWCDRYEREPTWLLMIAFLWGAVPAILLSIAVGILLESPRSVMVPGAAGYIVQLGLISPIVEEMAKAVALLGFILYYRRSFDGVLDGIVYGALIGVGFAMTENFVYFTQTLTTMADHNLAGATLLRSGVFGLNHGFYTAITGASFGVVAARGSRLRQDWVVPAFGLTLAIIIHAVHNLSTSLAIHYPILFLVSLVLNWGGLLVLVAIIILAWRQENTWLRLYLADEVPHVLTPFAYAMVLAYAQRFGRIRAYLRGKKKAEIELEAELHQAATRLAFAKHRFVEGGSTSQPALPFEIISLRFRVMHLSKAYQRQTSQR